MVITDWPSWPILSLFCTFRTLGRFESYFLDHRVLLARGLSSFFWFSGRLFPDDWLRAADECRSCACCDFASCRWKLPWRIGGGFLYTGRYNLTENIRFLKQHANRHEIENYVPLWAQNFETLSSEPPCEFPWPLAPVTLDEFLSASNGRRGFAWILSFLIKAYCMHRWIDSRPLFTFTFKMTKIGGVLELSVRS